MADNADGTAAIVTVGGTHVITVIGGQGMVLADIVVSDKNA